MSSPDKERVVQSESTDSRVSVKAGYDHDTQQLVTDVIVVDRTSSSGEHDHIIISAKTGEIIKHT